jgi:hypothetical protein
MRTGDREGRGSLGHGDVGDEAARGEGSDVASNQNSTDSLMIGHLAHDRKLSCAHGCLLIREANLWVHGHREGLSIRSCTTNNHELI